MSSMTKPMLLVRLSKGGVGWFADIDDMDMLICLHFPSSKYLFPVLQFFITHFQTHQISFMLDGVKLSTKDIDQYCSQFMDYYFQD
jgi:hypothetical protein